MIIQKHEVLDLLRSDEDAKLNSAFSFFYTNSYNRVEAMIRKMGGNREEAEDIFQEGLMVLYKKAQASDLDIKQSAEVYLIGICKNLWLGYFRKKRFSVGVAPLEQAPAEPEKEHTDAKLFLEDIVRHYIRTLGEKCKTMLNHFYQERKSMKEIAEMFSLSSEQAAKDRKYRCLQKLKKMVVESPAYTQWLSDN